MLSTQQWENIPGFDPVETKFIRLDLERWLDKHGIAQDAKARGTENLPPSDAKNLGDQERNIVAWINRRALDCRQKVTGYLSDLTQNLVDIEDDAGLKITVQRADEIVAKATTELDDHVEVQLGRLDSLKRDLRIAADDFKDFRERSGISRLADYSQRKWALPVILFCFAVEVVLNAALLMDVNAFGLIGSTVQMGLISAVNVLIGGLAMGALLRQVHHRSPARKAVASIAMTVIIGAVVAFNLAIGHFRDSMQAVLSDPSADIFSLGNDALVRYADGPFQLDSFQSALLALLGVLFFALASWKWLHRDDPYPGYGPRARQLDHLREDYARSYDAAKSRLTAAYKQHDSLLLDIRHDLQIRQEKWEGTRLQGAHIREEYPINMRQYQLDLDRLLERWRTVNKDHRSTPPPSYFDQPKLIDQNLVSPLTFDPPASAPLTSVMDHVHNAVTTLHQNYTDAASRYHSLSAITGSDGTIAG